MNGRGCIVERHTDEESPGFAGQITHYPYEIGSQITIANTHYQYYQLNMDEDTDGDENSDIVVWYCLGASGDGSAVYTSSPNDVRNNYYIYNIGNITYSGVGHSTISNKNEKQLFFNTIVAAYKTRTPRNFWFTV